MKNIKTIIFDLGAVILNISYQNTIDEFEKLGIKNAKSFYSKKSQANLFNQIEIGKISEIDFLAELQKRMPNANLKQIKDAWNAMLLDLPEKRVNLIRKLKHNFSIILMSNTNAIHISALKSKLGIKDYNKFYNLFDKVYYSHKIGLRKPHAKAFKLILNENKLIANEVLFIDDSPQHIKGAEEIGIKTYHLSENEDINNLFADITL